MKIDPNNTNDKPSSQSRLLNEKKYTIPKASKLLGIGETYLRQMIVNGEIPVIFMAKKKMVLLESDLEMFLKSKYVRITKAEVNVHSRLPPLPEHVRNSKHLRR